MIWLITILICIAGLCKGLSDTLAWHYDFFITKFPKLKDKDFWKINVVHKRVTTLPFTKYPLDAWHIANSIAILCWAIAIVIHTPVFAWYIELPVIIALVIIFINISLYKLFV